MSDDEDDKVVEFKRPKKKAAGSGPSGPDDWKAKLTKERGGPTSNLWNALIALQEAPAMQGLVCWDEMRNDILLMRPVPHYGEALLAGTHSPRPISDHDIVGLKLWMQGAGMKKMGKETVMEAALLVAKESPVHPVRDWLSGLKWDGKPRIMTWLADYLGAELSDYSRLAGSMFLISMVARIFEPGCKVDTALVLTGSQGLGKSEACRALAGSDYFSDTLPHLAKPGPDVSAHLSGRWLVEMAEMHSVKGAAKTAVKAFISRRVEIFRPVWGRVEQTRPRSVVFIGTTNEDEFLDDETGNRRFWPVRCEADIDFRAIEYGREQLFAEAVKDYRAGVKWYPDKEEAELFAAVAEEHRIEEDMDHFIKRAIEAIAQKSTSLKAYEVTVSEVMDQLVAPGSPPLPKVYGSITMKIKEYFKRYKWKREPNPNYTKENRKRWKYNEKGVVWSKDATGKDWRID